MTTPEWSVPPALRLAGPGTTISGMWSWFAAAPPKGAEKQWKDGRSAKELARAWCRAGIPSMPAEMVETLSSHSDTVGFVAWDAIPELVTPLDAERGEARNHDLVVVGVANGAATLVGVEAKAGEPFGDKTVAQRLAAGVATPRSGVSRRIAGLVEAITGQRPDFASGEEIPVGLSDRGYQLLTATVGTVIEAGRRHCSRAVLLVHEFAPATPPPNLARDLADARADLDAFVGVLSGDRISHITPTTVVGPFALHPTAHVPAGVKLYVGKAVTLL